jgi:hypothetical protein
MDIPVGPLIQVGFALLGLIILVSLALGWGRNRDDNEDDGGTGTEA